MLQASALLLDLLERSDLPEIFSEHGIERSICHLWRSGGPIKIKTASAIA